MSICKHVLTRHVMPHMCDNMLRIFFKVSKRYKAEAIRVLQNVRKTGMQFDVQQRDRDKIVSKFVEACICNNIEAAKQVHRESYDFLSVQQRRTMIEDGLLLPFMGLRSFQRLYAEFEEFISVEWVLRRYVRESGTSPLIADWLVEEKFKKTSPLAWNTTLYEQLLMDDDNGSNPVTLSKKTTRGFLDWFILETSPPDNECHDVRVTYFRKLFIAITGTDESGWLLEKCLESLHDSDLILYDADEYEEGHVTFKSMVEAAQEADDDDRCLEWLRKQGYFDYFKHRNEAPDPSSDDDYWY